jgi:hypothetical protein
MRNQGAMVEDLIMRHVQRLARDIGPRPTGTAANIKAYEYLREVIGVTDARLSTHEVMRQLEVAEQWSCQAETPSGTKHVPILPGVSTRALRATRMPVMQRIYANIDDFAETRPEPGSVAVVSLGTIHESDACIAAYPAAAVVWFREGHPGLYAGNCMRPGKAPIVPGFAIDETTAGEWTTHHVSVSAEIVAENRPIALRNLIADMGDETPKPCFVAHYDSKPLAPGGNDNASGVAVLLALLQTWPADRAARFIFFDGEEAGLLGSQAYVDDLVAHDRLAEIDFVVCPDSVGLGELHLYTADRFGPFPDDLLARARTTFNEHGWPIPERAARSGSSDYRPFHELGVPCLFLSDFPNHVRHTTIDTADVVDTGVLTRLAAVLRSETLTSR